MPKRRDWTDQAIIAWQKAYNLPPIQLDESAESFTQRVIYQSTKNHSLTKMADVLMDKMQMRISKQALSQWFKEIGIKNLKVRITQQKKDQAIRLYKTQRYTDRQVALIMDIDYRALQPILRQEFLSNPDLHIGTCPVCKQEYKKYRNNQKYCNIKCNHQDYYGVKAPMFKEYPCKQCGKPYIKTSGRRLYCDSCTNPYQALRRHLEKKKTENNAKNNNEHRQENGTA